MKSGGVSARLLPLMDISMLLLGMLMVMMAYSQVKVEESVKQSADSSPLQEFIEAGVVVIPMIPIAVGPNAGMLAVLNEELVRTGYINPDHPDEFKALLRKRGANPDEQVVIALLFIDEGADRGLREAYLKEQWGVPIAKARFPKNLRPQS